MPLDLGSFQLSPAEAAALRRLEQSFGAGWRSALIINVWFAADGGASYFDSDTCRVLRSLRSSPTFPLNAALPTRPAPHKEIHRREH